MEITTAKLVALLKQVPDPLTGQDLVTALRIRDVKIEGRAVSFALEFPKIDDQTKMQLITRCHEVIGEAFPEAEVNIHFLLQGGGEGQAAEAEKPLPHVQNIIAVASGKGGVGKSTVSVNLALALKALGARVGLMDADLYGPSIPTMLGLQAQRPRISEVYGKPKIQPLEAHGMPVISLGNIIEAEQAVVLRGPRLAAIIRQFFFDVIWPPLDFLVVDLPPGTGDIQLTLVQTVPVTGVVMVTTPQAVALADAVKAMNMFRHSSVNVPILGVVENMSWFTPPELPDKKYFLFGRGGGKELAQKAQSVLLGQIPIVEQVREGGDTGKPPVLDEASPVGQAFLEVGKNVLRQVAIRNETLEPTRVVRTEG